MLLFLQFGSINFDSVLFSFFLVFGSINCVWQWPCRRDVMGLNRKKIASVLVQNFSLVFVSFIHVQKCSFFIFMRFDLDCCSFLQIGLPYSWMELALCIRFWFVLYRLVFDFPCDFRFLFTALTHRFVFFGFLSQILRSIDMIGSALWNASDFLFFFLLFVIVRKSFSHGMCPWSFRQCHATHTYPCQ